MIYCVEDDSAIRELLLYTLHNSGFEAKGLEDGEALFAEMAREKPALILLDVMLRARTALKSSSASVWTHPRAASPSLC